MLNEPHIWASLKGCYLKTGRKENERDGCHPLLAGAAKPRKLFALSLL